MKIKVVRVVLSFFGIIGIFMPVATGSGLIAYIHHVGGIGYLLYVIPIVLFGLSVLSIYREVKYVNAWFISVSLFGLIVLIFTVYTGISKINAMSNLFTTFGLAENEELISKALPGTVFC
ncbi:hypothetical protein [Thermodesulfobacterium thermophilum]|uniref:hypothetical protein n=1 Tax=Thermodesulfobacterium thermophilum TaxID=886 RepID=UPI0012DE01A8|nr:hypothetical protein [Thermodesulfobacterium thermophilum]